MRSAIAQFLRYLATERNASDLTIKAYREDLFGLLDWLESTYGKTPRPESLSHLLQSPLVLTGPLALTHPAAKCTPDSEDAKKKCTIS